MRKKMYMLPMNVPTMYLCKFLILTVLLLIAVCFQNLALAKIGVTDLPQGTFEAHTLISFAGYSVSYVNACIVLYAFGIVAI